MVIAINFSVSMIVPVRIYLMKGSAVFSYLKKQSNWVLSRSTACKRFHFQTLWIKIFFFFAVDRNQQELHPITSTRYGLKSNLFKVLAVLGSMPTRINHKCEANVQGAVAFMRLLHWSLSCTQAHYHRSCSLLKCKELYNDDSIQRKYILLESKKRRNSLKTIL